MDIYEFEQPQSYDRSLSTRGFGMVYYHTHETPAEFFYQAVFLAYESEQKGTPQYRQDEFIRFYMPGGHTWERKVKEEDKIRYKQQYQQFKADQEQVQGYPIDKWPQLTVDQVATLKHIGLKTVQALAAASDQTIQKYGMGGMALRNQAKAFLDTAQKNEPVAALTAENNHLRAEIEDLKRQYASLISAMGKPGNKKKKEAEDLTHLDAQNVLIDDYSPSKS